MNENAKAMETFDKKIESMKNSWREFFVVFAENSGVLDGLKDLSEGLAGVAQLFAFFSQSTGGFFSKLLPTLIGIQVAIWGISKGVEKFAGVDFKTLISNWTGVGGAISNANVQSKMREAIEKSLINSGLESAEMAKVQEAVFKQLGITIDKDVMTKKNLTAATKAATSAQRALMLETIKLNAIMIGITIAIGLIVSGIAQWNAHQEEIKQKIKDTAQEASNQNNVLTELMGKYNELISLTSQDESARKELKSVQEEIVKLLGLEKEGIDLVNKSRDASIEKINKESLEKLRQNQSDLKLAKNEAENASKNSQGSSKFLWSNFDFFKDTSFFNSFSDLENKSFKILRNTKDFKELWGSGAGLSPTVGFKNTGKNIQEKIEILNSTIKLLEESGIQEGNVYTQLIVSRKNYQEIFDAENKAIKEYNENLATQGVLLTQLEKGTPDTTNLDDFKKAAVEAAAKQAGLKEVSEEFKNIVNEMVLEIFPQFSDKLNNTLSGADALSGAILNTAKTYVEASEAVDNFQSSAKNLASIYEQVSNGEKISADTMLDLIQKYPEQIGFIQDVINGKKSSLSLAEKLFEVEKQTTIASLIQTQAKQKAEKDLAQAVLNTAQARVSADYNKFMAGGAQGRIEYFKLQDSIKESQKIIDAYNVIDTQIKVIQGLTLKGYSEDLNNKSNNSSKSSLESLTEAKIRAIMEEYNLQKVKSKAIEQEISLEKARGNNAKAIEKTTDLIKSEKDAIEDLNNANNKLESQQTGLVNSSKYKKFKNNIDGKDSWFDAEGNETTTFINAKNTLIDKKNKTKDEDSKKSIQAQIDLMQKFFDKYSAYIKAVASNTELITESELEMQQLEINLAQERLDNIAQVEDIITDIIKKQVEERKKAYDEQYENLEKNVNAAKNLINAQYDSDDYKKNEKKQQDKITELEQKRSNLARNDSLSNKANIIKLDEEIATEREKLIEMQNAREKDLKLQNLDDILKSERQRIDAEKAKLDEKYTDTNIAKMAKDALKNNGFTDINGQFKDLTVIALEFENTFGDGLTALGDQIKYNLINNINEAVDSMKTLYSDINKLGGLNYSGLTWQQYNALSSGNIDIARAANGGLTPSWGSGAKAMFVDQDELILKKFDTSNMLKMFKITEQLLPRINLPQSSGAGMGEVYITMPEIKIYGNIDNSNIYKLQGTIKTTASDVINEFKKAAIHR